MSYGVFTSKGTISKAFIGYSEPKWCLWAHNTHELLQSFESFEECLAFVYPEKITYSRSPTEYEIKLGYGARHYREFSPIDCVHNNGKLKKWFKANDGLRYYR